MRAAFFLPLVILILVLSMAGCNSQAEMVPGVPGPNSPSATQQLKIESEVVPTEAVHIYGSNSPSVPVVFEGEVVERLRSDGFWCGYLASFQGIRYRTSDAAVGNAKGEVVVYHYLVGPPHCEEDEPVLSRRIFALGNRLRIQATRNAKGTYYCSEAAENVQMIP